MKDFKLSLGDKVISIQVPDHLEIEREEAFALALLKLQDAITDGVCAVTQRVWPCFACSVDYDNQAHLSGHMRSEEHSRKTAGLHKLADKHMREKETEPFKKAHAPSAYQFTRYSRPSPSSEHKKEYGKQHYIKRQLGEV